MTIRHITAADIAAVKVDFVTIRAVLDQLVREGALTAEDAFAIRKRRPRSNLKSKA